MNAPQLPGSLVDNPRLDRWIHFEPDKTVRVASGKVEIGQGVVTALGQIAADELDVPLERVTLLSGDTVHGPDEMYTTSSLSISMSGGSIRLVCAEVRGSVTSNSCRRTVRSAAAGVWLRRRTQGASASAAARRKERGTDVGRRFTPRSCLGHVTGR